MPDSREPDHGLDITVRVGTGTGRTVLAAFDDALLGAGVGDLNLITLSSVIPPGSTVRTGVSDAVAAGFGDRLYCVKSVGFADHPGEMVSAGLGWAINTATGGGLFVEHSGGSDESVSEQIRFSLGDMTQNRGGGYDTVQEAIISAHCIDRPVCALAVAVYQTATWSADA